MKKNGKIMVDGFQMMKIVLFFHLSFIKYIILLKEKINIILVNIGDRILLNLVLKMIYLIKIHWILRKKDKANKYFTYFDKDYEINGGEKEFQTEELEVFRII